MKITPRIQFNLHTKGKIQRLENVVLALGVYLLIGRMRWHPQWFQALWIVSYIAGADFFFSYSKLEIIGMLSKAAGFFKRKPKSDFNKYAEQLARSATGINPPPNMEIHFLSNPLAPSSWKLKFATDTDEGKTKFLKKYWQFLKAGQYGGYNP